MRPKTMARMRNMSRFSCPVGVYRQGVCELLLCVLVIILRHVRVGQEKDSADLVPGDIVSITQPALSVFPADMILLSGDAIVNESMLTGESVPVSKIPIKDVDLAKWKDVTLVTPEITKSFLYAGTRVVRVRGSMTVDGGTGGPALAIVARIGTYPFDSDIVFISDNVFKDSIQQKDLLLDQCYFPNHLVLHFTGIPCDLLVFWLA